MNKITFNQDKIFRWISIIVTSFAGVFILIKDWNLTGTQVVFIGFAFVLTGALLAGAKFQSWATVFGLFLFGFYLVARGAGYIEQPLFRYILGPFLLLMALAHVVMIMNPAKENSKDTNDS